MIVHNFFDMKKRDSRSSMTVLDRVQRVEEEDAAKSSRRVD